MPWRRGARCMAAAAAAAAAITFLCAADFKYGRMLFWELSYVGAEVVASQRRRPLFILVTGVQGSGTTMVARILGHPQWSMAFGGVSHPVLSPELFRDRKQLWDIGRTTDEVWQVTKRLERRRPAANATAATGAPEATAMTAAPATAAAVSRDEDLASILDQSHGCQGFDHFAPRVLPEAPGDRKSFVKPLLKRIRWLMEESRYSTHTRDARGRSVYVFHKVRLSIYIFHKVHGRRRACVLC